MNKIEFFSNTLTADPENPIISGYAVLFNKESRPMDYFGFNYKTVISPNAFSIESDTDVKLLLEHDTKQILAREKNNSLTFEKDDKGLKFTATLGKSRIQRDVVELIRQGIYSNMSFGVQVLDQEWDEDVDPAIRTITSGKLLEFSIVSDPQFSDTNVDLLVASNEVDSAVKKHVESKNEKVLLQQQLKFSKIIESINL
jgi:uncharacterized protein